MKILMTASLILVFSVFFADCGTPAGKGPDVGINKNDTVTRPSPSLDDTVGHSPYTKDTLKNHLDSIKGADSLHK